MVEKNRNILSNAIQEMGKRSPAASNWDNIASDLDQLEASQFLSNNVDKLPGHSAPADAWDKIAAGLPSAPFAFFTSLTGKFIIGSLLLAGLLAGWFLFFDLEDETKETVVYNPATTSSTKNLPEEASVSQEKTAPPPSIVVEEVAENQAYQDVANSLPPPIPIIESNPQEPKAESPAELFNLSSIGAKRIKTEPQGDIRTRQDENLAVQPYETEYYKDPAKTEILLGAFFAYKHFQNMDQEGMSIPENLFSFGLDLLYGKNRWFLKTGLEYLAWKESGNYTTSYEQNQLVYEYNYVDSTYINPDNGSVTYFTTEKEVYDSVPGQTSDEASYNYRVLQIPLILGYRFYEGAKFNASVSGGIGFDIRLSGKQFVPAFSEEEATVTDVNNSLIYRTETNWRVIIGIEAAYKISNKVDIYIEPGYQWYMKPLYSPEDASGVGFFNLKTGLRYNF